MNRSDEIFNKVLDAMQEAEEIDGVEGFKYLILMLQIANEAQARWINCYKNMEVNK